MLSSVLSWHLNRRNQNYILDLPAFNQGALQCSHTHHRFMECFDCFVSSTIELSCLHWSTLELFMWFKSSPRVPCTVASCHKWNRNNSCVTFFSPTLTSHGSSNLWSSHHSGFPLFKKFAMLSGPPWPVRGVAKGCKAGEEHQCFGSLVNLILRGYGQSEEIDK